MHCARNTEILHNSLSCNVGSSSSQFLCERRLDQGHPACHPLYLVTWRKHSTIRALDKLASSLASLASSPGPSFLRHYLTILPDKKCHEYIIPSWRPNPVGGGANL